MQDNQAINKARALYYNLFANFFVPPENLENYLELVKLVDVLKASPLDVTSGKALEAISSSLDKSSNVALLQEFDDIFHNPISKKIRTTASYYDEGVESGKKRVEMINFVAKTKLRRDEKNFYEYEDSVGFIFTLMAQLTDLISQGEKEYENTVHCIFSSILNDFIDEFAKELYEHESAFIYKELMVVLHSYIEFERLFLEVSKPAPKEKIKKVESCDVEEISEEERERRERNKALRALGPKEEVKPSDIAYDVEEDI
ncbi:TorD/DmsD family molecular chaperone [Arcobacter sp. YIC-464]|uniref:TorD/DmsD family molecular chaperone n=1 Tax=Arcobacter sp. YIC-464 TaxID=3376631 RepID=UPI003C252D7C